MRNYLILSILVLATVGCYKSLDIDPETKDTAPPVYEQISDFGFEYHQPYDLTGFCPGFNEEVVVGAIVFISDHWVYTGSYTQGGQNVAYEIDGTVMTIHTPIQDEVFHWNAEEEHFKNVVDDCVFMIYL